MLAAIGMIIFLKQLPVVFGEKPPGEPLEVLTNLPAGSPPRPRGLRRAGG
jgi:hypothetical protein